MSQPSAPRGGPRLPHLPDEAFRRVLCVVAHPDDVEYGTSAAVAVWTARGVDVSYLLLTRGEAGMDGTAPEEAAPLRHAEQLAAGREVGVEDVEILRHPDGVLEYSLALRRDIARAVRRTRPDAVVLTSWEIEFVAGLNQADHRVAGLAALDAVRDAGNRWVFRDLLDEGLEPWSVRWVLASGNPRPTHAVDVTGPPTEAAVRSLEAHGAYLASIASHPPARAVVEGITGAHGRLLGTANAVAFRVWDLQAPPSFDDGA
ncbi:PIG-L family deacetylase [Actinotalea ferrariae]|uniref:PIG-L deacetylase family protein n=1 Tax=Actinotalea ferrariae TaxID=1386098 RepID=UPI001C8B75B4|nr:PIG-L deacetylase family protein [Actinotalea ferrariae]MBX9243526.1 PIG-L family deacetylase [Actinotalea ferrariae]